MAIPRRARMSRSTSALTTLTTAMGVAMTTSDVTRALDALNACANACDAIATEEFASDEFASIGKAIKRLAKTHDDVDVRAKAKNVKEQMMREILKRHASTTTTTTTTTGGDTAKEGGDGARKREREGKDDGGDELGDYKVRIKGRLERTGDEGRDRTREIFADALAPCMMDGKVEGVAVEKLAEIAGTIENAMRAKWPDGGKDYKAKVRQLAFNLKDTKNPDLRTSMANGDVSPDVLIELSPEELGSNERRSENKKIREHAEWEAVRGQQQEASTDAFKCGKCKQRKCTYYQLQTRSADEPMTTFVTCVNCGNRWKFC